MLFGKKLDDKEVECQFCHKKVKPIIERNKMAIGLGLVPGPFLGELVLVLQKNLIDLFSFVLNVKL